MPRTLTANFQSAAAKKNSAPYLVLEIDWGAPTGTQYYLDRPAGSFNVQDGFRIPATGIGAALVVNWGRISLALKEGQIGATDQTTIALDDYQGQITAILNQAEQQRRIVTIYRMFDDPTVLWNSDKAFVLVGCLRPFDWTAKDNQITLNLGDLGPLLAKDISCIASKVVFPKIAPASQDKNIPLCWGRAQRVEALPISVPWETKIAQSTTGANPITLPITDDTSLLPGVTAETAYDAYIGTDPITATFHQSPDPTSILSTVTLNAGSPPVLAGLSSIGLIPNVSGFKVVATYYNIMPKTLWASLESVVSVGQAVLVTNANSPPPDQAGCTVLGIVKYPPGRNADDGYYYSFYSWTLTLSDNANGVLANGLANSSALNVKLLGPSPVINIWPTGTILRPKDQTTIYAISALPSKAVQSVEGYGTAADQAGDTREDFVVLGQIATQITSGSSTATVVSNYFSINLNNSTWNAGGLGRNITTITFPSSPRSWVPALKDNRIWCTVLGVEDAGNSSGNLITNPATVILQYLENANLMNVAASSIDVNSFTAAATALAGYSLGFAQVEAAKGLEQLQDIARQCHSALLFDQGLARLVVLTDAAGTIQRAFDTSAHDNMLQGSLMTSESAVDDVVNEVNFKWRGCWDDKTGQQPHDSKNYKTSSISAFGHMTRETPIYVFWRRSDVEAERDWWLGHWSSIWRTVKFTAFLDALILEVGDWITVQWIDGAGRDLFGGAKPMQVTKLADRAADGLIDIEARYVQRTY